MPPGGPKLKSSDPCRNSAAHGLPSAARGASQIWSNSQESDHQATCDRLSSPPDTPHDRRSREDRPSGAASTARTTRRTRRAPPDVTVRVRVPEWKSRWRFCAGTTPKVSAQPDVQKAPAGNAPRPPLAPRESAPLRPSGPHCPKKTPRRAAARRLSSGSMGSTAPRPPRVQGRRKPSLARPSRGRRRGRPHVERRTAVDRCRHLAPLNSPTPATGERENARGDRTLGRSIPLPTK